MYEEEFYHEPSEFEMQIDALKQSLMDSVKAEHTEKMERLMKENAELQEVKKNFEQIKRDYKDKERKLESERNELERNVRRERISQLFKGFEPVMYRPKYNYDYGPKCDKCDSYRQVKYKTPLGRDAKEDCECKRHIGNYVVEEMHCCSFRYHGGGDPITFWFKPYSADKADSDYVNESSTLMKVIYTDGMEFESLSYRDVFFYNKEECQKYCDWLTDQKK